MYETIKKLLENGNKKGSVTKEKLDVFLKTRMITDSEYEELLELLNNK